MKGSQLQFLAEVADLARLDFEAASITLITYEKRLVSRYQGAYSSGQRWLELKDIENPPPKLATTVSAMQFKSLVGLFSDEEEVDVSVRGTKIHLQSQIKGIDMSIRGEPEGVEPFEPPSDEWVEAPVSVVLREIECASEFSARSMAKPILTGLRIVGQNGRLGIQSSDGVSTLFETRIAVNGGQQMDMITPGYDLVLGLKLLGTGNVKLLRMPNVQRVGLYGDSAVFQSSLLAGTWPDFSKVRQPHHRQSVKINSSLVRSLVQSVRILGASNDLRLRSDGENLHLETVEAEAGSFDAKIASNVQGTYTFDVGSFLLAQSLGPELVVQLPNEGRVPTLIEAGQRRFWIAAKL